MKTKKEYQAFYEKAQQAKQKWAKENMVGISFRLSLAKDNDLIEWISRQPNKADAFRRLIRKAIEEER